MSSFLNNKMLGSGLLPHVGVRGAVNYISFQTNKSGTFNPSVTVSDGSLVTWDYGDGTTSTGATANRTYPDSTTKTVTVTFANPAAVTHLDFQSQSLVGTFNLSQLSVLTGLREFRGYSNASWNVTGALGDLPSGMTYLYLASTASTITGGVSAPLASGLQNAQLYSCNYSQAQLDELLQYIYTHRAQWTHSAPVLHIGGTNPAPSGTYADEDPPTTGKGYIYELVVDPESEGFKKWAITYTV
ncbi:MAG: PKD domain-containing protein [Candidatus Riesia sp.]|nr:PKD domain-containing protein [Candidatus Riesia sp.]